MIEINIELFVLIFFVWILITSIVNILVGIMCWGDEKTYGPNEIISGVFWLIVVGILLII